ncbi:alpha/beta hydrolase [Microbacterium caowuchunii]|nr:alpha/beta hydrolase [Microbacterium caowuchunii]
MTPRWGDLPMTSGATTRIADPELADWLASIQSQEYAAPSISRAREKRSRPAGPEISVVRDEVLAAENAVPVPVRVYRHDAEKTRTTCVYVHGGAFVFGDLDSHDRACRRLAALGRIDVVAVDYRRAPEHPFPAAIDDVRTVLAAVRHSIGSDQPLGLAGDSAGALIAFSAAEAPDIAVDRLLMVNPNVDLTLSMPSVESWGTGWGLDARDLEWFVSKWAPTSAIRGSSTLDPLRRAPLATPMTTIITSEYDPLRDEGLALAEHLQRAGRLTRHHHLDGMVHGVINLDTVSPTARRWGDCFLTEFAEELINSRG